MNRIQEALEHKTIFITGATGFLGQPLVEKILRIAPRVERLYLLIRPKVQLGGQTMTAEERLTKELFQSNVFDRLRRFYGDKSRAFLEEKLVAVSGDISQEGLGIDEALRSRLQEEVDIVINSAAAVSFDAPLNEALAVNVLSAGRIAEFASSCKKVVLIHVSTAYVNGANSYSVPEAVHHATSSPNADPPLTNNLICPPNSRCSRENSCRPMFLPSVRSTDWLTRFEVFSKFDFSADLGVLKMRRSMSSRIRA